MEDNTSTPANLMEYANKYPPPMIRHVAVQYLEVPPETVELLLDKHRLDIVAVSFDCLNYWRCKNGYTPGAKDRLEKILANACASREPATGKSHTNPSIETKKATDQLYATSSQRMPYRSKISAGRPSRKRTFKGRLFSKVLHKRTFWYIYSVMVVIAMIVPVAKIWMMFPANFPGEEKEIQYLTKQWYQGLKWQRIRTIPWIQGDYFPLTHTCTNLTFAFEDESGEILDKFIPYENMFNFGCIKTKRDTFKYVRDIFTRIMLGPNTCYKLNVNFMDKTAQRILLHALPGFHKTLLTQRIASDWSRGYLPVFDFVFVIKAKYMNADETIEEAIVHQVKTLKESNIDYNSISKILRSDRLEVLIVLDGLNDVNLEKYPLVKSLVTGEAFLNCWLLVTTQPYLVSRIKQSFHSLVRIMGFSDDSVQALVTTMSKERSITQRITKSHLNTYLRHLRQENNGTYYSCPFLVHATITMVQDNSYMMEDTGYNPTHFYASLVRFILKTNQVKKQLDDRQQFQNALLYAMELAYQGAIKSTPLVIEMKKLGDPHVLKLGLLSMYERYGVYSSTTEVEFIHSTIQDFLAGCYIAKSFDSKEGLGVMEQYLNSNNNGEFDRWSEVIGFAIG